MIDGTFTRAVWPIHVVDGDTVDLLEDDGRRCYTVRRERILGIDTPELFDPDPNTRAQARAAKAGTAQWFQEHLGCNTETLSWPAVDLALMGEYVEVPYFLVAPRKHDSFDRWLSDVQCQAGHSLAGWLLDRGLAVVWTR